MPTYDPSFESMRLSMLSHQYPEIIQEHGRVLFIANDDKDELIVTTWQCEDNTFKKANESNFKTHLILLIDDFIEYRGQCNELPKKEGIIKFGSGKIEIKWVATGTVSSLKENIHEDNQ